ncbi:hypothetical protein, partial [Pedobacter frigidisoli]|uniref:hypothetical protein n=1 Tax=Pedobacter frigidisoli TaxID=2530455 RepID=UPI00197F037A
MVYQDFKYRGIYWWLFPLLWVEVTCYGAFQFGWILVFNLGGLNGLFILFQVFVLSLYISLKNRKPTNIFQGFFGLGDLLFLLCAAFAFSVTYFIVFYILSLLFAIGITLLLKLSAKERLDKVPLAGYQALMLM